MIETSQMALDQEGLFKDLFEKPYKTSVFDITS